MTNRSPERQKPFYSLNNNVRQQSCGEVPSLSVDSTSSATGGGGGGVLAAGVGTGTVVSVSSGAGTGIGAGGGTVIRGHRTECTLRERIRRRVSSSSSTSAAVAGSGRLSRRPLHQLTARMPLRKPPSPSPSPSAPVRQPTLDQLLNGCNARAMRYYRVWIYTCNAVLFLSVLAFCAVAARVLVADYRRHLIPNLTMYQPSFLYAYLALFTQSGVLQVIGCIGALRLSERLLNVYWLMLLILLFGDIVIGIFWMFRFDKICQELKPNLRFRLHTEYGYNSEMTVLWDRLQTDYSCCGVQNAMDFGNLNRSGAQMLSWISEPSSAGNDPMPASVYIVPISCCTVITEERIITGNATDSSPKNQTHRNICQEVHTAGCEEKLQLYLRQTADILFILGYCVIAFLKLCFLGILRYEIREMIQKIKILQAEMETRPSIISLDNNSSQNLGMSSPSHTILINTASINGSVPGNACDSTRTSTLHKPSYESTESERESLLVREPQTTTIDSCVPIATTSSSCPKSATRAFLSAENLEYHQRSLQDSCRTRLLPADLAGDSDTNSHCALLSEDPSTSPPQQFKNPNGNNNYELHEFREHSITALTPQRSTGGRLSTPDTSTTQNI